MEDEESSQEDDDDSETYTKRDIKGISDVDADIERTLNTNNVETNVKLTEENDIEDEYVVSSDDEIDSLTEEDDETQTDQESDLKENSVFLGIRIFKERMSKLGKKLESLEVPESVGGQTMKNRCVMYLLHCLPDNQIDPYTDEWPSILNILKVFLRYKMTKGTVMDVIQSNTRLFIKQGTCYTFAAENIRVDSFIAFCHDMRTFCNIIRLASLRTLQQFLKYNSSEQESSNKSIKQQICEVEKLVVLRLQLNVISHSLTQNDDFCTDVSSILNIPKTIISSCAQENDKCIKYMIENSRVVCPWTETFKIRMSSMGSVADYITKSNIGLEKCNDVFVLNDEIRTLQNKFRDINVDQRSILCCILLQHDFVIHLNNDHWMRTLNKLREKMNLKVYNHAGEVDIFRLIEGVTVIVDNKLTFQSVNVRHDVMYSFVADLLWNINNLDFFLRESSITAILEYCRHDEYQSIYEERCIFLPYMYRILLIERLQLDIIVHPVINDTDMRKRASYALHDKYGKLVTGIWSEREERYNCIIANSYQVSTSPLELISEENNFWTGQITKSTIAQGKHYHLDVFVINDEVRTVVDAFRYLSPDMKSILYCLVLHPYYTIDLSNDSWIDRLQTLRRKMNITTQRSEIECLKSLERNEETILAITENEVTFESDELRHSVMSAFVADILWHEDNLEFFLRESSVTALAEYCRHNKHKIKSGERCILLPEKFTDLLILRLESLNEEVIVQPVMEDNEIRRRVTRKLKIPFDCFKRIRQDRRVLSTLTSKTRFKQSGMILKSTVGLEHPYPYDVFVYNNQVSTLQNKFRELSIGERCFLFCYLFIGNSIIDIDSGDWWNTLTSIRRHINAAGKESKREILHGLKQLENTIILRSTKQIRLKGVENKHDIMFSFIADCLWDTSKLEIFLNELHIDIIKEYCVPYDYKIQPGERCILIPPQLLDGMIKRLDIDVLTHRIVEDERYHSRISEISKIPVEIMKWDEDSRKRYVNEVKKGSQSVFRARGMIVGCAGAGKTTLMMRLNKNTYQQIKKVKSTVGLEVYYDIFEIDEKKRSLKKCKRTKMDQEKTLTLMDFGGQCAYYACHQIYLTNRAFYILVIDISKRFDEKVDSKVCDQHDTLFADWTYEGYCEFWLKSIYTYCDSETPILVVFTHCENKKDSEIDAFIEKVLDLLPEQSENFDRKRFFVLKFPHMNPVSKFVSPLTQGELERGIVDIITHQKSWGENIPSSWLSFAKVLEEHMPLRVMELEMLRGQRYAALSDLTDILRFYHEIGRILFFNEDGLNKHIIVDVQWFIDAFKTVITDSHHVRHSVQKRKEWKEFYDTGVLPDTLLQTMWDAEKSVQIHPNTEQKQILLSYMQRLGLIALGKTTHYVPSMNKKALNQKSRNYIDNNELKSTILYYKFEFLPIFLFYRLVVLIMALDGWHKFTDNYDWIFKNMALFRYMDHDVIVAVTGCYIQLQVFVEECRKINIERETTLRIRQVVEEKVNLLCTTFHKRLTYTVGFSCKAVLLCDDVKDTFINEAFFLKCSDKDEIGCPIRHALGDNHNLKQENIVWPWIKQAAKETSSKYYANSPPTDSELAGVSRHIGMSYEILGAFLGISVAEMDRIKMDNTTSLSRIYSMLISWRGKEGSRATKDFLMEAVQKTGNIDEEAVFDILKYDTEGRESNWRSYCTGYKMDHKKRGTVFIINNDIFQTLPNRDGSQADVANLETCFQELKFEMEFFSNKSAEEMRNIMSTVSDLDNTNSDCFVCVVMSHGNHGYIAGVDGELVAYEQICDPIIQCKSLRGKPKILFIQSCRGSHTDDGNGSQQSRTSTDADTNISMKSDFLMMLATYPGYKSYRDTYDGSWFIQTLCKVLKRDYKNNHLREMLTTVNREIAEMETEDGLKQTSSIERDTTRFPIYFT